MVGKQSEGGRDGLREEVGGEGIEGIVRKAIREGWKEVMEGIVGEIREVVRKEVTGWIGELRGMGQKGKEESRELVKKMEKLEERRQGLEEKEGERKDGKNEGGKEERERSKGIERRLGMRKREELKRGWKEESRQLGMMLDKLEERRQGLEEKEGERKDGENEDGKEERERSKGIERRLEVMEREEKKRNLIVRGVSVKEGEEKEKVKEIMEGIGVKGGVEEVRKLGGRGKELLMVKMESMEKKKEVLRKKIGIKDRKVWVEEDWTWEERRMRWNLKCREEEERRKGKRVFRGYGGLNIEGKWWKWDEEKGRVVEEGGAGKEIEVEKSAGNGGRRMAGTLSLECVRVWSGMGVGWMEG